MRLLPPGLVLNLLALLALVAYLADPDDERPVSQGGKVLGTHPGRVVAVAFSPDGRWLASAGYDSPVVIWNMAGLRVEADLERSPASTFGVAFSPDGETLAAAGIDGAVRVWETGTWSLLRVIQAHSGAARSLSFSPDGKLLATVGVDGVIALWSTDTWRARKRVQAQEGVLRCVAFSPDGSGLATVGREGLVRLWDVELVGVDVPIRRRFAPGQGAHGQPRVLARRPDPRGTPGHRTDGALGSRRRTAADDAGTAPGA